MPTRVPRTRPLRAFVPKPPPLPTYKAPPVYVPKDPPEGAVPHPRRPRLVRDTGSPLLDLFAFFPDLPRPAWFQSRRASGARFWRRFRAR